ncbi:MAG: type II secretion system F family protein [Proteobacteria bacterium]|nr:MAG: type II secretion system F family protein [Pseudomonadota bacterium]QKK10498.1 MAG: type II secretion system F family protein [Pseudomonadota bacterium]
MIGGTVQFEYKARGRGGEALTGVIEAPSKEAVATQLTTQGVTPIQILAKSGVPTEKSSVLERFRKRPPNIDDLIFLSRQMYALMKAGVPMLRSIGGLAESARNERLREVLQKIRDDLESGRTLSASLARHPRVFSSLYVSIMQVGETTGQMDDAFLQMARYLEQEKHTRARIRQAMRYPVIVLGAISIAIVIINLMVIPAFAQMFANARLELPWATKLLLAVSAFFVNYWPHMLVGLFGGIWLLRRYLRTARGAYRWDRLKLRLPIIGPIVLRSILARFSRAFAISFKAGVPLVAALTTVSNAVDNHFVGDKVRSMRNGIERGDSLTRTAAATGLFTTVILQMLSVGEETGSVDAMLLEAADFYEREVDYDLKYLSDALEPILIAGVGVMVLILALGVFLPMWDMAQIARSGR